MSLQQLLLIAAAALLMFWVLGAHNRLVALRNAIIEAWQQLDEPLQRRAAALGALADALRAHLPDEGGAFDAVRAALTQLHRAVDALRARPALAPRAAAFRAADGVLAAAQSRLLALVEQHRELATADDLAPHLATLRDAAQRQQFARQLFNDAVCRYNDAARQFPTRLLAGLFGFGTAGTL